MFKKVYIPFPKEDWIVDRCVKEFISHTLHQIVSTPQETSIVFLFAGWIWNQIPLEVLKIKKIIKTYHHCVPSKFNQQEFDFCEQFVDVYHVPNKHTNAFLKTKTAKKIIQLPYWIDTTNFFPMEIDKEKLNLPKDKTIIGSFVRDTEGKDLITPKLEKDPVKLGDIFEKLDKNKYHILLSGHRRQYIISRLEKMKMSYTYLELYPNTNELYNACDYYINPSAFEGGPYSLLEAPLNKKTKILSTDVGLASEILHPSCLCHSVDEFVNKIENNKIDHTIDYNYKSVQNFSIDRIVPLYDTMIENED